MAINDNSVTTDTNTVTGFPDPYLNLQWDTTTSVASSGPLLYQSTPTYQWCQGGHVAKEDSIIVKDGVIHAVCSGCNSLMQLHSVPSGLPTDAVKELLGSLLALTQGVDLPEFDFGEALGSYAELDASLSEQEIEVRQMRKLLDIARKMIDKRAQDEV